MNAIGGYFELELREGEHYHKNALRLNTARNCFEYILRAKHYTHVYIPYYTCEVMLEPLRKLNVNYTFYSISNSLVPVDCPLLKQGEAFLYTNYFGIKQSDVIRLADLYGNQLIVDNSQAFFSPVISGIDTFYSPRKFFGVPDGAYLYSDKILKEELKTDVSYERMSHLLKRIDLNAEDAYSDFKLNDEALNEQPVLKMAKMTQRLLQSIDYQMIIEKRQYNFEYLHSVLQQANKLDININNEMVPMVYPYFVENGEELKKKLIAKNIYTATYWPNVFNWVQKESNEYLFANQLLSLPIDQRYEKKDMEYILNILKK